MCNKLLSSSIFVLSISLLLDSRAVGQTEIFRFHGDGGDPDRFAENVCRAGDLDADGVEDILVSAYRDDTMSGGLPVDAGSVWAFSGRDGSVIWKIYGSGTPLQQIEEFGRGISAAGDLDLDGHGDFLVGAPNAGAGRVEAISGRTGLRLFSVQGPQPNSHIGVSLGALGDVNGDGIPDVITSAVGSAGWALSGSSGLPIYEIDPGSALRRPIGVGDMNQDAIPDILISGSNGGKVVSGADGSTVIHRFQLPQATEIITQVASVADTNGDGIPDFVVSVSGGPAIGYLFSGRNAGILHSFVSPPPGSAGGSSVTGLGDIDQDGYADLAIGESQILRIDVFSGRTGALLFAIDNPDGANGYFGHAVSGISDLNQDGIPEILTGTRYFGYVNGFASVFSGRTISGGRIHPYQGSNGCGGGLLPVAPLHATTLAPNGGSPMTFSVVGSPSPFAQAVLVLGRDRADLHPNPFNNCYPLLVKPILQTLSMPIVQTASNDGRADFTISLPPTSGGYSFTVQAWLTSPTSASRGSLGIEVEIP